jgi:hypothetical protein
MQIKKNLQMKETRRKIKSQGKKKFKTNNKDKCLVDTKRNKMRRKTKQTL